MTSKRLLGKKLILIIAVAAIATALLVSLVIYGPHAPEVTYTTLKGEKFTTATLRGKVVLINFWATSCVTCVHEMPQIISTYEKYAPQGFETVAVAMSYDPPNYVLNYAQTNKLPFKVVLDVQGEIANAFGNVRVTPSTFIIDKEGKIARQFIGEPDFGELNHLLENLIANP